MVFLLIIFTLFLVYIFRDFIRLLIQIGFFLMIASFIIGLIGPILAFIIPVGGVILIVMLIMAVFGES